MHRFYAVQSLAHPLLFLLLIFYMICILNEIHKVNWWEIVLLVDCIIHLCFLRIFSSQITLLPSVVFYKGFNLHWLKLKPSVSLGFKA